MKKFKSYVEFVNENGEDNEVQLNMILSALTRNYNIKKVFMTDEVPFEVIEDIRDWSPELRQTVKMGQTKEERAKFTLRYKVDNVECSFAVDFTMKLRGQAETDSPEPGVYRSDDMFPMVVGDIASPVSVKLVGIEIHSITIDTPDFAGTIRNFSENTLRNVLNTMIKILQPEYDVLGEKLRLIAMQQN